MLDDASYNGTPPQAPDGVLHDPGPDLDRDPARGGTVTITYSVTVHGPDTGDKILAGTLSSASPGQQLPGRSNDPGARPPSPCRS